jgi:hypothetical protein
MLSDECTELLWLSLAHFSALCHPVCFCDTMLFMRSGVVVWTSSLCAILALRSLYTVTVHYVADMPYMNQVPSAS